MRISPILSIGVKSPRAIKIAIMGLSIALGLLAIDPAHALEPVDLFRKAAAGSTVAVDHSAWDRLLKVYVKPSSDGFNSVDYAAFKSSGQADLKAYVVAMQKIDPQTLDRPEQFAFLANLYNAKTIDIVLDKYPVKSIKDISLGGGLFASISGGPWKAKVLRLKGVSLSLDDIEHGILRPVFKDPRVHYAVNCASIGCPNLGTEAFTGAKLNAQLGVNARAFVNHPRGATVDTNGLTVSSIYNWFQEDFGGSEQGVIAHLKKYAGPGLATKLQSVNAINKHQYDWTINDVRHAGAGE